MKKNQQLAMLLACGAAATVTQVSNAQPYVVNTFGATLLANLLQAPAITNDYIDVDLDGLHTRNAIPNADRLADDLPNSIQAVGYLPGNRLIHQYRAIGSVNGLDELVEWGGRGPISYCTTGSTTATMSAAATNPGFINAEQYLGSGGLPTGVLSWLHNTGHGGAVGFRTTTTGTYQALPFAGANVASPGGGIRNDAAPIDVPSQWGVTTGTSADAAPLLRPATTGYGTSPRLSVNRQGGTSGANTSNRMVDLRYGLKLYNDGPDGVRGTSDDNPASADNLTIFDTQIAWAPIVPIANFGTGIQQITLSDLQHLVLSGRRSSGENIHVVTRDVGSGTHNGFINSLGVDPSWGVGENIGAPNNSSNTDSTGPNFIPGNKVGTSNVRTTVQRNRLTLGYVGGDSWDSNTRRAADIVAVVKDYGRGSGAGPATPVRPTVNNILDNGLNGEIDPSTGIAKTVDGWQIGGKAIFATIGNPLLAPTNRGGYGWPAFAGVPGSIIPNDSNPGFPASAKMDSVEAAAFINNISRSIQAFNASPTSTATFFSPGEFVASLLIPLNSIDRLQDDTGTGFPNNPFRSQFTQDFVRGNTGLVYNSLAAEYATYGKDGGPGGADGIEGRNPTRQTNIVYSDGRFDATASYLLQSGAAAGYNADSNIRNRIVGDFNADGVRDINDATEMLKAWRQRNSALPLDSNIGTNPNAWVSPAGTGLLAGAAAGNASIEILGDFSGDGNFGRRWIGTGTATAGDMTNNNPANWAPDFMDVRFFADGAALVGGLLDRKAGFTAVDTEWLALTGSDDNFFNTTKALGAYQIGDSRADIANSSGLQARGFLPIGADGNDGVITPGVDNIINKFDIDYISTQINTQLDRQVNWANVEDAANADLSADVTGDLKIDCNDVNEVVVNILATSIKDINLDGAVDGLDAAIATANLGTLPATWSRGEVTCDGVIDQNDVDFINGLPVCDDIDFNGDGVFPDNQDIIDFLEVFAGATCPTGNCNDIDFNNDGVFPDNADIIVFLEVFAGGFCS